MEISKGVLMNLLADNGCKVSSEMLDMVINNIGATAIDGMLGGRDVLEVCLRIANTDTAYNVVSEVFRRNNCHIERERELMGQNKRLQERLDKLESNLRSLVNVSFPHVSEQKSVETPKPVETPKQIETPSPVKVISKHTPHDTSKLGKTPVVINKNDLDQRQLEYYTTILKRTANSLNTHGIKTQINFSELVGREFVHRLAQRFAIEKHKTSTRTTHSSAALLCAYYATDPEVASMVESALR